MKNLEQIAAELYNLYCVRETGKPGSWPHLSPKRKVVWMKEVMLSAGFVVSEIRKELKPLPTKNKHDTSYAQGVYDGVTSERVTFMQLIEGIYQKLKSDIEKVENDENSKEN